jgi:hypothetical protein
MTKDVIELAREAGLVPASLPVGMREWKKTALAKFADLVAARERERVANLVLTTDTWRNAGWVSTICPITTQAIAAAIRALNTEGEGNDPITG